MVDWPSKLWPASFRGVPFYVEKDTEAGKRRIVSHEFPMRDTPFHEDLGEGLRNWDVTAYVASDSATVQAAALAAVLALPGAAVLVLPTAGPVQARVTEWKREQTRDQQGFIAFTIQFVREGAEFGLIGVAQLAQQVFNGADVLGTAAGLIVSAIEVRNLPGSVADAAVAGLQDACAILEDLRTSNAVDPTISAQAADLLSSLYDDAPTLISRRTGADVTAGERLVAAARLIGDGMAASDASAVFGALSDAEPPTPAAYTLAPTPAVRQRNDARLDRVLRLATLAAWGDSLMGKTYASRGDGVADRALASIRFGIALADLGGAENLEAYAAAAAQRGRVAAYLSRLITDLAPVITVNAPVRLPSLYWAWRLYEDPTRAAELVARNAIRHPAHMPPSFQALAS